MTPLFERLFGLAWTSRLAGWRLLLVTVASLLVAGAAAAFFVSIWPAANDPKLEPSGSPGVVREGRRLAFVGQVPWVGRQAATSKRISFGDAPPDESPAPDTWFHYGPDGVISHTPTGTTTLAPFELEWKIRGQIGALNVIQNLLLAAVMFFVISVLLRVKGIHLPAFGPVRILGRCLIPACVYEGALTLVGGLPGVVSVGAFLVVMGMNALLFVLGARPEPAETPFDV